MNLLINAFGEEASRSWANRNKWLSRFHIGSELMVEIRESTTVTSEQLLWISAAMMMNGDIWISSLWSSYSPHIATESMISLSRNCKVLQCFHLFANSFPLAWVLRLQFFGRWRRSTSSRFAPASGNVSIVSEFSISSGDRLEKQLGNACLAETRKWLSLLGNRLLTYTHLQSNRSETSQSLCRKASLIAFPGSLECYEFCMFLGNWYGQ